MQKNIYWFCFIRQLRELYLLLTAEKLIKCSEEEFISHFAGKKFPDTVYSTKIKWYGSSKTLSAMFGYLAGKGFVNTVDVKVYDITIPGVSLDEMIKEHFKVIDSGKPGKNNFAKNLESLFPSATAYRCKTRLFYKARNKQPIANVLSAVIK